MKEISNKNKVKIHLVYTLTSLEQSNKVGKLVSLLRLDGIDVTIDVLDINNTQKVNEIKNNWISDYSIHKLIVVCDRALNNIVKNDTNFKFRELISEKFIPIILEKNEKGSLCIPLFLDPKYIDLTPENFVEGYCLLLKTVINKKIPDRYYHVIIELKEKMQSNKQRYEYDYTSVTEVIEDIILQYTSENSISFDGSLIKSKDVETIKIRSSLLPINSIVSMEHVDSFYNSKFLKEDLVLNDDFTKDETSIFFRKANELRREKDNINNNLDKGENNIKDFTKVFIVHGHDTLAKMDAARFVEKLGFTAIILHEQASNSDTIIEKIERYSNVGFALVLYTPCDIGGKKDAEQNLQSRARQNVVFEHGYLMGKIGRKNVCALVKEEVETPNDISGIVYVTMDQNDGWRMKVAKEMEGSGYIIDYPKLSY